MKKLTFILLFVVIGFISYGQKDTTNYVTNSDIEKLVDKYSVKIEASIVSLAETLKQPAEHVYKIMVKQQYVKGFIGIFVLFICVLLIVMALYYAGNVTDWEEFEVRKGTNTASGALTLIFGIIGSIMFVIFFACGFLRDILQGFINPEYGAIKDIINLF